MCKYSKKLLNLHQYIDTKMKKLTIDEMERISVAEFKAAAKAPLILVSDNVRSLNNIGSFFRTADAFRLQGIWLCGISGTPPSAEIHKTALGAEDSVEWRYFENTLDAVSHLKADGYEVWALEQAHDSVKLENFSVSPDARIALVVGNEIKGVSQNVIDECSGCIEIPQYGTKHSLNVSVAAGITLYNIVKQLNYCASESRSQTCLGYAERSQ